MNRDLLEFKFQGFITVTGLFEQSETAEIYSTASANVSFNNLVPRYPYISYNGFDMLMSLTARNLLVLSDTARNRNFT